MSTAAKLTLAGTTAGAIGIVIFVHLQQKFDKAVSITSFTNRGTSLTCIRLCTRALFAIWNSKRSKGRGRPTLKCKGSWRSSIKKCRLSATVQTVKSKGNERLNIEMSGEKEEDCNKICQRYGFGHVMPHRRCGRDRAQWPDTLG